MQAAEHGKFHGGNYLLRRIIFTAIAATPAAASSGSRPGSGTLANAVGTTVSITAFIAVPVIPSAFC